MESDQGVWAKTGVHRSEKKAGKRRAVSPEPEGEVAVEAARIEDSLLTRWLLPLVLGRQRVTAKAPSSAGSTPRNLYDDPQIKLRHAGVYIDCERAW
jgi:hypothetical protein